MKFGIQTDTGDLDGKIEREHKKIPTKNDLIKLKKNLSAAQIKKLLNILL